MKTYIRLSSGLGNQIFIYMFSKLIKDKNNVEIIFETSSYLNDKSNRNIEIEIFEDNLNFKKFPFQKTFRFRKLYGFLNRVKIIEEDNFDFNTIENYENNNLLLNGYWQNLNFLNEIEDFSKYLIPKTPAPKEIALIEDTIPKDSVAIHVRRGDYFNFYKDRYGVCDLEYYNKAIKEMKSKGDFKYYIFSDDIDWCKINLTILQNEECKFVPNLKINSFWYIHLMSKCRNLIIPNSTYSWWATYLNNTTERLVISPKFWRRDLLSFNLNRDNWLIINNLND
jgi:hypothetical protein